MSFIFCWNAVPEYLLDTPRMLKLTPVINIIVNVSWPMCFLFYSLRTYNRDWKKKQLHSEKPVYSLEMMFILEFVTIQFFHQSVNVKTTQSIKKSRRKVKAPINRLLVAAKTRIGWLLWCKHLNRISTIFAITFWVIYCLRCIYFESVYNAFICM